MRRDNSTRQHHNKEKGPTEQQQTEDSRLRTGSRQQSIMQTEEETSRRCNDERYQEHISGQDTARQGTKACTTTKLDNQTRQHTLECVLVASLHQPKQRRHNPVAPNHTTFV